MEQLNNKRKVGDEEQGGEEQQQKVKKQKKGGAASKKAAKRVWYIHSTVQLKITKFHEDAFIGETVVLVAGKGEFCSFLAR